MRCQKENVENIGTLRKDRRSAKEYITVHKHWYTKEAEGTPTDKNPIVPAYLPTRSTHDAGAINGAGGPVGRAWVQFRGKVLLYMESGAYHGEHLLYLDAAKWGSVDFEVSEIIDRV